MQEKNELLRKLPKVDELLMVRGIQLVEQEYGHTTVLLAARNTVDELRAEILAGGRERIPSDTELAVQIAQEAQRMSSPTFRKVINATGVVLHTNLGRARLSEKAARAAYDVARGYSNLEYDIGRGQRGSRHSLVSSLLCELTGAEDAMVVNNNAAAVLLMLAAMAAGREVVVSRGELVEIGGSFRVPDIMTLSGAVLREVGTTNRTHLADYQRVIGEQTGALLKVHTSNFRVVGFTQEIELAAMVELGKSVGLPVLYDLGGGLLRPVEGVSIPGEPCVTESLKTGVDVVCFSGDKLLGGPQAGIVLGRREYIERLKKHPLARALRVDKMTLAALETTLLSYRDEDVALRQVPTLQMLAAPQDELMDKAKRLAALLDFAGGVSVVEEEGQVGGGTAPGHIIPAAAVAIAASVMEPERLETQLRLWEMPIVARISRDTLLLDVRTIDEDDFGTIAACLRQVLDKEPQA